MNARAMLPRTRAEFLAELRLLPAGGALVYAFGTAGPLAEVARDAAAARFCTLHVRRPSADGVRSPDIQYVAIRTKCAWDDAALPGKPPRRQSR
jgi:hypothetical protein